MRRNGPHRTRDVFIHSEGRVLHGLFRVPPHARAVALLLTQQHALGGDLARSLARTRIASLAVNVLPTEQPDDDSRDAASRCLDSLCSRVFDITVWLRERPETAALPLFFLAEGLSAAGAVIEAARQPALVGGIVLRNAILAAAGPWLHRLRSPLLLAKPDAHPDALAAWLAARLVQAPALARGHAAGSPANEDALPGRCRKARTLPLRETAQPGFVR